MSEQRPGDTIPHQKATEAIIDARLTQSGNVDLSDLPADQVIGWNNDVLLERSGTNVLRIMKKLNVVEDATESSGIFLDGSVASCYTAIWAANPALCWAVAHADDSFERYGVSRDGELSWGTGAAGRDTTLARHATGILRIDQQGGGIRLTSPDGTQSKTIRLSNAGAVEVVV